MHLDSRIYAFHGQQYESYNAMEADMGNDSNIQFSPPKHSW